MNYNLKVKYEFTFGRFTRKTLIRAIKSACHQLGIQLEYEEDKGIFDSVYYCTLIGTENALTRFDKWWDAVEDDVV